MGYDVLVSPRIIMKIKDADGLARPERRNFEPSLKDWWDYGQAEMKANLLCWIVFPTPGW